MRSGSLLRGKDPFADIALGRFAGLIAQDAQRVEQVDLAVAVGVGADLVIGQLLSGRDPLEVGGVHDIELPVAVCIADITRGGFNRTDRVGDGIELFVADIIIDQPGILDRVEALG